MTIITYLLTQNRYSRSGKKLESPKGIVLHNCMNDGYSAIAERNFMDNLKLGKNAVYYSTHYIVGTGGEIINCIPESEASSHSRGNEKGSEYISIEYCRKKAEDPPGYNTKASIKRLVIDISKRYGFNIGECLLRHSDISERRCPLYYAQNNDRWIAFKKEVEAEKRAIEGLEKNSAHTAECLEQLIGVDKRYIKLILEQRVQPDALAMAGIINKLMEIGKTASNT